ncbi:MAG: hypothetical protein ABFC24_06130, partial [Methanoregulaceae archaeon]
GNFPKKEHLYENPVTVYICMKITFSCAVFLVLVFLLVSAVGAESVTATISSADLTASAKPYVSATVSSASVTAGQPVTISGVATGNVTDVEIWFFGDSYGNSVIVPVDANGTYNYTVETASLAPQVYYVLIQSPGLDGKMALNYDNGTIVNAANASASVKYVDESGKTVLLNATQGVESLQAVLNSGDGIDDVYTKVSFEVTAPSAASATTVQPATTQAPAPVMTTAAPAATKKSPVSPVIGMIGIGLACCALYGAGRIRK